MLIANKLVEQQAHIEPAALREKPIRSIAKALSWRITGSLDTVLLSWFFTQSMHTAVAIGLTEVLTKTLLYYGHERLWSRLRLGVG